MKPQLIRHQHKDGSPEHDHSWWSSKTRLLCSLKGEWVKRTLAEHLTDHK